jgi:SAM-dependent methyltransferase
VNKELGAKPAAMPVDSDAWGRELNLSNFINTCHQFKDVQRLPSVQRILVVGLGQGLDTAVLRWRGYDVTTFDIDPAFRPDFLGSVHDLHMFADHRFDVVIASHVIEHLPIRYLDTALSELARVARFALIYVPTAGRPVELRVSPGFGGLNFSIVFDLYNWFIRPNPVKALFCSGQHYWELGRLGFSRQQFAKRISNYFEIIRSYRNKDWLFSFNYVLQSRAIKKL